ncbi:hypothetical protein B0O80DRAFT_492022 [Mortierella sp. GBAus27b]|nr:hypothetical protein B0O80DRAFT_492022 [Mortierella sp. GBAus27b]
MADLTIWCLVNGTSSSENAFSVNVPSSGTVYDLKRAIKDQNTETFKAIDAKDLTLWRVCVANTDDDELPILLDSLDEKKKLRPATRISKVFTEELPEETVHIIVQPPPSVPLQPPGSPSIAKKAFNTLLEKLEKDFFHTDTHISRFLCSFVKGDLTIPNAKCCVKGLPRTWVRSRDLLQASTQPALYLLHPKRPHSMTSPSVQALDKIKKYQNNDMITFFGVSGCGKTRAVVEMLAQNWGFYLNGSQTDRGMQNGLNVQAITVCLLISRLMVLQHCLSLGRHDTFTCDRWMLLQVCPGAFDATVPDVFDIVFTAVLDTYHEQTPVIPLPSLERLLQERFRQVQGQISSFTPDPRTNKLLVVLDEAQTLSDHGRNFFVSHVDSEQPRSFLSPIIYGLRSISKNSLDYCVVTCGTGIGADELEILVNSGGMATNEPRIDPRILNFPGWETEDQVATYINSLGDAMSEDDRAMLHTLIPKAAVQELFLKLRGRFRPIITTIEDIIASGSASHWKQAIEIRVEALVSYPKIFPVRGNLCSDIKRMLEKVAKDPAKFEDAVDLSLPGEEPILVESAFGRIREAADKAAATETTIDEPFVFRAAYNFIRNEEKGFYEMFKKQYHI